MKKRGQGLVITGALGLMLSIVAMSATAASGCWLEIYDQGGMQGKKVRIEGPKELPSLAKLSGENWSDRIDSLEVGPKAQVYAFRQENFKEDESGMAYHGEAIRAWGEDPKTYGDREISFGPGRKEHHLGELHFHQNINSLKIECIP